MRKKKGEKIQKIDDYFHICIPGTECIPHSLGFFTSSYSVLLVCEATIQMSSGKNAFPIIQTAFGALTSYFSSCQNNVAESERARERGSCQFFSALFQHATTTTTTALAFPPQESGGRKREKGFMLFKKMALFGVYRGSYLVKMRLAFPIGIVALNFLKWHELAIYFLGWRRALLCTHKHRKQAHVT